MAIRNIKMIKKQNKNNQKGFTLVELMVSILVFTIVGVITASIFIEALTIQRRSSEAQYIQENALAVLGLLAKEIRVATIIGPDNCVDNSLNMTVYTSGGVAIPVTYSLSGGFVVRDYGGTGYYVSSNTVVFNSLIFCIQNSGVDGKQTRVTILASISGKNGSVDPVQLQTTVVSRDVTLELHY